MHPAQWTFVAALLLVLGIVEEWQAPRRRIAQVLRATESLRDGRSNPMEDGVLRWAGRWLLERVKPWLPGAQMAELREQLLWAGQPFGLSAEEFFFAKIGFTMAAALVVPLLGFAGGSRSPAGLMALAGAVAYIIPERLLKQRIAERSRQVRIQLPNFVHLLATALEAGLPIMEAVRRVSTEAPGLLAAEMFRTVQEMAAGKPAITAWQHLASRTQCQELRDVVTAIIQSQEFGVAVAEQLRFQMRSMRLKKQQEAQEKAQAASAKMRIPTILFILGPTMVILLGPAFVTLMRQLKGG